MSDVNACRPVCPRGFSGVAAGPPIMRRSLVMVMKLDTTRRAPREARGARICRIPLSSCRVSRWNVGFRRIGKRWLG